MVSPNIDNIQNLIEANHELGRRNRKLSRRLKRKEAEAEAWKARFHILLGQRQQQQQQTGQISIWLREAVQDRLIQDTWALADQEKMGQPVEPVVQNSPEDLMASPMVQADLEVTNIPEVRSAAEVRNAPANLMVDPMVPADLEATNLPEDRTEVRNAPANLMVDPMVPVDLEARNETPVDPEDLMVDPTVPEDSEAAVVPEDLMADPRNAFEAVPMSDLDALSEFLQDDAHKRPLKRKCEEEQSQLSSKTFVADGGENQFEALFDLYVLNSVEKKP